MSEREESPQPLPKHFVSLFLSNSEFQCTFLVLICITVAAFSISLPQMTSLSVIPSISLLNLTLLVVAFILLSKSNQDVPNLSMTFSICFCSILIFNLCSDFAFVGIPFCLIIPTLVLKLTKSYIHCIVSLFIQLINVTLLFRIHLEDIIKYMSSEKLVERITQCMTLSSFIILIMFVVFYQNEITLVQKEKDVCLFSEYFHGQQNFSFDKEKLFTNFTSEVENLLKTITGSLDLLFNHIEKGLGTKLIKIALVSTENLQRIFENMATISSRGDENHQESGSVPTSISNLFENLWETALLYIDKKGLKGSLNIDETLPQTVDINENKVRSIVLNLLDFLIQTTPKGSIDLTVENIEPEIEEELLEFVSETVHKPYIFSARNNIERDRTADHFGSLKIGSRPSWCTPKTKSNRMMKVTLRSNMSQDSSRKSDNVSRGGYSSSLPIASQIAQLSLLVSEKMCEKLGGKVSIYTKNSSGATITAYIPFALMLNNCHKSNKS